MKKNYNMENHLSFDKLPNAVHVLNVKMDKILLLIRSPIPEKQKNKLLTVQEDENFLNLSMSTVYSKYSKNTLPHMKKGKRLHFDRDELVVYIKSGKVKTVSELETGVDDFLSSHKRSMQGNILSVTQIKK